MFLRNVLSQLFYSSTFCEILPKPDNIQFWVNLKQSALFIFGFEIFPIILLGVAEKEHAEVLKIVESVKMQQHLVLEKLQIEQDQLEQELDSMGVHEMMKDMMMSGTIKQTGIPDEAHELECPDEQLKASVLEEFILLDKKFETQLEYLDLKYQHVKQ